MKYLFKLAILPIFLILGGFQDLLAVRNLAGRGLSPAEVLGGHGVGKKASLETLDQNIANLRVRVFKLEEIVTKNSDKLKGKKGVSTETIFKEIEELHEAAKKDNKKNDRQDLQIQHVKNMIEKMQQQFDAIRSQFGHEPTPATTQTFGALGRPPRSAPSRPAEASLGQPVVSAGPAAQPRREAWHSEVPTDLQQSQSPTISRSLSTDTLSRSYGPELKSASQFIGSSNSGDILTSQLSEERPSSPGAWSAPQSPPSSQLPAPSEDMS